MTRPDSELPQLNNDVRICGDRWLPEEWFYVEHSQGCFATITLAKSDGYEHNADREQQQVVYNKLYSILSCSAMP